MTNPPSCTQGESGDLGATRSQLLRMTRLYAMLSRINRTIVRSENVEELYEAACRIAVDDGNLSFTWIGLYDAHSELIVPVAQSGGSAEMMQIRVRIDGDPEGQGPSGTAVRTGEPCVYNDIDHDPRVLPWRSLMQTLHAKSVASFPLRIEDRIVGVLGVGARETDYFQEAEMNLLSEVADDISFAMGVLRRDEQRLAGEAKLQYLAYYDTQTGLPRRNLFEQRLASMLQAAKPRSSERAVMVVCLCRYYEVLNVLGPEAGAVIARAVSGRLEAQLPLAFIGRIGQSEFAIALERDADMAELENIAWRVREVLAEGMHVDAQEVFMDPALGIALYPRDGTPGEVLKAARLAADRRGYDGGVACRFFVPEMDRGSRHRLDMDTALRRALARDEFVLHYQPQIDLQSGQVVGAEALLRWQRPGQGMISPIEFIPVLEDTGLICEVGAWVLEEASRVCQRWRTRGLPPMRMAVNLSARQFRERDLRQLVRTVLRDSGLDPQALELEITESVVMFQADAVIRTLHDLKDDGVSHAMDDFGTGYSSLSYLQRLPISRLKIDRSFVSNIIANANDAAIVRAVIGMAHSLGVTVIAEGVETAAQLGYLRGLGCEEMQGYYFSRPVPEAEFATLLLERRCIPPAPEPLTI
jgi:EAL domain-containing protein (putative c-di-GMP-specific phosphodiesterase class I)/GGDEF domain-containing protein/putative methionine-R-sulfoxide reductase with GAF domain